MSRPRRKYGSPEAVKAALRHKYETIWKKYVEVANPPSTLYHYCREDILSKILSSGKLWASDVFRMNDPDEITYAFAEIIGPFAATVDDGLPKYFIKSVKPPDVVREVWGGFCTHIACLSSTPELPSQWERYAKCTGYAIGFDRSALEAWCIRQSISLLPMSYDLAHDQKIIGQFLEEEKDIELRRNLSGPSLARNALRNKAIVYLASLAMTLKRAKWQNEEEWRILVIQTDGTNRFERLSRDDGVSYFELPIVTAGIATEVVLGPRCCADLAEVRSQVDSAGLKSVKVRRCVCQCPELSALETNVGVEQS